MKPLHKIVLVCTTFLLAAATGHVMQNSVQFGLDEVAPAPAPAPSPEGEAPQLANDLPPKGQAPAKPTPANPAPLLPASVAAAPVVQASSSPASDDMPPAEPDRKLALADTSAPALDLPQMRTPAPDLGTTALPQDSTEAASGFATPTSCPKPHISAEPAPSASVRITVDAPCQSSPEAEIRHEGLRLPILLSSEGHWSGIVPAMAEEAVFVLDLADTILPPIVSVRVPDIATVNRMAVTAGPLRGFALHGYEYNATPGGMGDVSVLAPRDPATDLGGWLVSFETPETLMPTQIYTAPATMADIALALEVTVTPESCGKDMVGAATRLVGGVAEAAFLTLAMPDCNDGEGAVMMQLPDFAVSVAAAN